jgi:hypothetical protein
MVSFNKTPIVPFPEFILFIILEMLPLIIAEVSLIFLSFITDCFKL